MFIFFLIGDGGGRVPAWATPHQGNGSRMGPRREKKHSIGGFVWGGFERWRKLETGLNTFLCIHSIPNPPFVIGFVLGNSECVHCLNQ